MSYHTAAPYDSKVPDCYKLVFEDNGYMAYEWSGRLFLYRKGKALGQLINGFAGLQKNYRNSFDVWIDKIKQKDLVKIKNIEADIRQMQLDCDAIRDVHA